MVDTGYSTITRKHVGLYTGELLGNVAGNVRDRLLERAVASLRWLRETKHARIPSHLDPDSLAWTDLAGQWIEWFGRQPIVPAILWLHFLQQFGWECPYSGLPMFAPVGGNNKESNWSLAATKEHFLSKADIKQTAVEAWKGDLLVASCVNDVFSRPKRAYRPFSNRLQIVLRAVVSTYESGTLRNVVDSRTRQIAKSFQVNAPGQGHDYLHCERFLGEAAQVLNLLREIHQVDLIYDQSDGPQPPSDLIEALKLYAA